jgi:hypothetical protein
MPAHKINPKLLATNLSINGPINNSVRWTLYPDTVVLATIPGPIVLTPGDPATQIGAFTLPAGVLPVGGAILRVNYAATVAAALSTATFILVDAGGSAITTNPIVTFVTTPAGSLGMTVALDLLDWQLYGSMQPWTPGPMSIQVWATCDIADLVTLTSVTLDGRYYADLLAVGP